MRLKDLLYKSIAVLLIVLFSFFLTASVARAEDAPSSQPTTPAPENQNDQEQEPATEPEEPPTLEEIETTLNSANESLNANNEATEAAIEEIIQEEVGPDATLDNEIQNNEELNNVIVVVTEKKTEAETVIQQAQTVLQEAQQIKQEIDAAVIVTPGLTVTVYNNLGQNAAPIIPGPDKIVHTTTASNINAQWGSGPIAGSNLSEDVVVKYEGNITSDTTGNIVFYAPGDDGVRLYLNGQLIINDWVDKGGGGSVSAPVAFEAGTSKEIVLYYYENGGGAWVQLNWNKGNGFQIVPSTAFDVVTPNAELQTTLTQELNTKVETLVQLVTQVQEKIQEVITTNETAIVQIQVIYNPPVQPPTEPVNPEPNPPSEPVQPEPQPEPEPSNPEPPVEPEPEPEPEPELEPEEPEPPIEEPVDPEPEVPQEPEPPLEEEDPGEESENTPEPEDPDTNDIDQESPEEEQPVSPVEPTNPQTPINPPVETIVLPNGVELPAEIAKALELVSDNPIELLNNILENPAEALKALLNIGADMSPEKREEAQTVVIAAIIVGQIMSTVAAAVQMSQARRM